MDKLILNLPLKLFLGYKRKKKEDGTKVSNHFYINLNEYRNADFHTLNKAKILFKEIIQDQLVKLPSFHWVTLEYFLFPGSHREMDTNNICSIADKFFSDALVEAGKLADDNYHFLKKSTFEFAEVDKNNPRVEVHITGQIKEPEEMLLKIEFDHSDFMTALSNHAKAHFPIPEGMRPEFDITAGRGEKGYSAVVTFVPDTTPAAEINQQQLAMKLAGNSMNRLEGDGMPPKGPTKKEATETLEEKPVESLPASQVDQPTPEPEVIPDEAPEEPVEELPVHTPEAEVPIAAKPTPAPVAVQPLFSFDKE